MFVSQWFYMLCCRCHSTCIYCPVSFLSCHADIDSFSLFLLVSSSHDHHAVLQIPCTGTLSTLILDSKPALCLHWFKFPFKTHFMDSIRYSYITKFKLVLLVCFVRIIFVCVCFSIELNCYLCQWCLFKLCDTL